MALGWGQIGPTAAKSGKIIALLEKMRRDLPLLPDRHDPVAAELAVPADPRFSAPFVALPSRTNSREPQICRRIEKAPEVALWRTSGRAVHFPPEEIAVLTRNVLIHRKIEPLTRTERARLEAAISEVRTVPARSIMVHKGQPLDHSTLLLKGLLSRYMDDQRGHRQFVALHVAGDMVDLHAYPMKQLDHDVAAVCDAEVAILPHAAIKAITAEDAELARKLWFATLLDAAMHREWIFVLGRLDAMGRVCHFFAETGARLDAIGEGTSRRFNLPMTQADIGEACGLTSVHVSRVLKSLRDAGLCSFKDGRVEIDDLATLIRRGQFDPAYLYLQPRGGAPDKEPSDG